MKSFHAEVDVCVCEQKEYHNDYGEKFSWGSWCVCVNRKSTIMTMMKSFHAEVDVCVCEQKEYHNDYDEKFSCRSWCVCVWTERVP